MKLGNSHSSKGQLTQSGDSEVVNLTSSKGQLTIFMLLGVVIIVSFGLLFFAVSVSQEAKLKQESERVLASFIETYAIKSYVESCLDITGSTALLQLGSQSRIYTEQGGTTELGKHIEIEHNNITANVSYGILRNSSNYTYFQDPTGFRFLAPEYPVPERTFEELNEDLPSHEVSGKLYYDGHYGGVFLPSLCNLTGLNSPETESIRYRFGSCMSTTYDFIEGMRGKSFQDEVGNAVSNKLRDCVNISYLASSFGYNISDAEPSVKIAYLPSSTKFIAEYPLTIRLRGGKPITQVYSFEKDLPVRLMKVYNLAFYLAKQDSRELFFDRAKTNYYCKTSIFKPEFCWDSDVDVSREKLDYDYLLRITDDNSLIEGEPFFFQYLIENRLPVLNWIDSPIYILENKTILLYPEGKDPDLETVSYSFKGWKETYDSWLDEECALTEKESNPSIEFSELMSLCTVYNYDLQPLNWSNNLEWVFEEMRTYYTPNSSDIGIHNLTVEVVDESGNKDYQIIEIWIYDLPKAVLKGENEYGLGENRTSIEDRYYLDGSESTSFSLELDGYEWGAYDLLDNEIFLEETEIPYFIIPNNVTGSEVRIEDIANEEFTIPGVYNLSLRVRTLEDWGEPAFLKLNVTECLPHSSNAPAYPFNNLQTFLFPGLDGYVSEENAFLADHTCCGSDYEFLSSSVACFNYEEYGPVNKLQGVQLSKFEDLDLVGPYNKEIVDLNNSEHDNDIYERSFETKCSGDRGNVCSGDSNDVFVLTSCGDDNLGVDDQTERCQGPDSIQISDSPLSCTNYNSGESFETVFGLEDSEGNTADGLCNEVFRTSNPTTNYGDTGPYSCQAECDSGTCNLPVNCECDNNNKCDELLYDDLLNGDISLNECASGNTITSCNVDCEYVPDTTCVYNPTIDCNAHQECDGEEKETTISNFEYCDSYCQYSSCEPYAMRPDLTCYDICIIDSHCADGHECSNSVCIESSP